MKSVQWIACACGGFLLAASGCARITTQVVEKPRVDQDLGGNRGYLAGSAPATASRRQTRQMVETNIELPTASEMTPWKVRKASPDASAPAAASAASSAMPEEASPTQQWQQEPTPPMEFAPAVEESASATTYQVKKGDTLEKIAAKVYGDSNQWRRIYNANRDKLKAPNRIYPGQELTLPAASKSHKTHHTSSSYK